MLFHRPCLRQQVCFFYSIRLHTKYQILYSWWPTAQNGMCQWFQHPELHFVTKLGSKFYQSMDHTSSFLSPFQDKFFHILIWSFQKYPRNSLQTDSLNRIDNDDFYFWKHLFLKLWMHFKTYFLCYNRLDLNAHAILSLFEAGQ